MGAMDEINRRLRAAKPYAGVADHMDAIATRMDLRTGEGDMFGAHSDVMIHTMLMCPKVPEKVARELYNDLTNCFRTIETKYQDIVRKIVEGSWDPEEEEVETKEKAPE